MSELVARDQDLEALIDILPLNIQSKLRDMDGFGDLLEVVLDLGRFPEARFPQGEYLLSDREVNEADLEYVVGRIGSFGDDNRAGIERTLHRISAIRNRKRKIVGLTCRVGRAVFGTTRLIEDLVCTGKSILLLGRPGMGKTTMLREVARVLADDAGKRVVIVDTSNEVAGDGDIPHRAIGHSRRMQVATPDLQHSVMIEAVENHMPEVIIIDEMGTELEASAARTIAERGVQLVATAHGNALENLVLNPTLSDLVGGVQTVILGDDEARRRRSQKTVLERKSPPTFDIVVEIQSWYRVAVHLNVAKVVDSILRGFPIDAELRVLDDAGAIRKFTEPSASSSLEEIPESSVGSFALPSGSLSRTSVLPFGVSKGRVHQITQAANMPVDVVDRLERADILLTTKQFFRKMPKLLRTAEDAGKSIFVLRKNNQIQLRDFLVGLSKEMGWQDPVVNAMSEAEEAILQLNNGDSDIVLSPQVAYIRKIQHQIANQRNLASISVGREPHRRVTISRR